MKKLNAKESKKVSGGNNWSATAFIVDYDESEAHKGEHIGKYDMSNYVGQRFIIMYTGGGAYRYQGILVRSYEKDDGCSTIRTHEFKTVDGSTTQEFSGDDFTCYLYND